MSDQDLKLPDIKHKNAYGGKFLDRWPMCPSAGMLTHDGDSVDSCLHQVQERPPTPDVVRKFRSSSHPDIGAMKVFYGTAYDPQRRWAMENVHGISSLPLTSVKEVIHPCQKTKFQQLLVDRQEKCYHSRKMQPLGRSYDQTLCLPLGLDPLQSTFGMPTQWDTGAGALINPNKSYDQVFSEACEGHELYVKSHADYYPMEQVCRRYPSQNFHPQRTYGKPTARCWDGKAMKQSMRWFHDTQGDLATKIVSKRLQDFRNKSEPQLGRHLHPIKDVKQLPAEHTFGAVYKPDPYSAGDIIHGRDFTNSQKGKESQKAVIAAVRNKLKKWNHTYFNNLLQAFRFYDQDGKGKITLSNLRSVCQMYKLPVDIDVLEKVFDYCDMDQDGMISYLEFANFLNFRDIMPTGLDDLGDPPVLLGADTNSGETLQQKQPPAPLIDESDLVPVSALGSQKKVALLQKQVDRNIGNHSLSSHSYNAVVSPLGASSQAFRCYGQPTVRSDLPIPRVKRFTDCKNYGEQAKVYSLLYPSVYSQHNISEQDLLQPRSLSEILSIFNNVGIRMSLGDLERAYNLAASQHPMGHVTIQSFKDTLHEIEADMIKTGEHVMALDETKSGQPVQLD